MLAMNNTAENDLAYCPKPTHLKPESAPNSGIEIESRVH